MSFGNADTRARSYRRTAASAHRSSPTGGRGNHSHCRQPACFLRCHCPRRTIREQLVQVSPQRSGFLSQSRKHIWLKVRLFGAVLLQLAPVGAANALLDVGDAVAELQHDGAQSRRYLGIGLLLALGARGSGSSVTAKMRVRACLHIPISQRSQAGVFRSSGRS